MKLLVCSDSHGAWRNLVSAVEAEAPDLLLHLGDGARDLEHVRERFPALRIESVRGNCDDDSAAPLLRVFPVEGRTVFMTHGHEHNVKWDRELMRLRYSALERDAALVCFGHTHRALLEQSLGMTVLNPGSIGYGAAPSYAVVTLENGTVAAELKRLEAKGRR